MIHSESLETRRLFNAVAIDRRFADHGTATIQFASGQDGTPVPTQVVSDASGHVYVVATTDHTLQIKKAEAFGTVYTHFAKNGTLTLARTDGQAAKVAVDGGGRIVVLTAGRLYRFLSNGKADTSFATKGSLKLTDFTTASDVSLAPDYHIYVTGGVGVGSRNVGTQTRLERFTVHGKLDRAFGTRGVYDLPFHRAAAGSRYATAQNQFVRALSDSSVVLADTEAYATTAKHKAYTSDVVQAVKFDADGAPFAGYGTAGVASAVQNVTGGNAVGDLSAVGIRAAGQVVSYDKPNFVNTDDGDDQPPAFRPKTVQISADGQDADQVTALNVADGTSVLQFVGLGDDRDVVVSDQGVVSVLAADGSADADFNDGQPFSISKSAHAGAAGLSNYTGDVLVAQDDGGSTIELRAYLDA